MSKALLQRGAFFLQAIVGELRQLVSIQANRLFTFVLMLRPQKPILVLSLLLAFVLVVSAQDAVREKKVLQKKMQEPPVLVWKALKLILRSGASFDSAKARQVLSPSDSLNAIRVLQAYSGDLLIRMRKDSLADLNRPVWSPSVVLESCAKLNKPLLAAEEDRLPLLFSRLMPRADRDSLYRLRALTAAPSDADFEHFMLALSSIKLARVPDLIALYELGEIRWNKLEMNAFRFHATHLYTQFLARKGMPLLAMEKLNQLEKDLETKPYKASGAEVSLNEVKQQLLCLHILRAQIGRQINQPEVQEKVLEDWSKALKLSPYGVSQEALVRIGAASVLLEAGKMKKAYKTLKQFKPGKQRLNPDELLILQTAQLLKEKKTAEAGKLLNESARYHFESMVLWDAWMKQQLDPDLWFHRKMAMGSQYPIYRLYHQLFAVKWQ